MLKDSQDGGAEFTLLVETVQYGGLLLRMLQLLLRVFVLSLALRVKPSAMIVSHGVLPHRVML